MQVIHLHAVFQSSLECPKHRAFESGKELLESVASVGYTVDPGLTVLERRLPQCAGETLWAHGLRNEVGHTIAVVLAKGGVFLIADLEVTPYIRFSAVTRTSSWRTACWLNLLICEIERKGNSIPVALFHPSDGQACTIAGVEDQTVTQRNPVVNRTVTEDH